MRLVGLWALVGFGLIVSKTWAAVSSSPDSILSEALTETVPTALAPAELSLNWFAIETSEPLPSGLRVEWEPRSLQWVRAGETLVLPRAVLRVIASNAFQGFASSNGREHPFREGTTRVPVLVRSGQEEVLLLHWSEGGQGRSVSIRLRPKYPNATQNRWFVDSTCSPYLVQIKEAQTSSWVSVGCRSRWVEGQDGHGLVLDIAVAWDGGGETIKINGTPTERSSNLVSTLTLGATGVSEFQSEGGRFLLSALVPAKAHAGSLGLGLGPYRYVLESDHERVDAITALLTLYGSYFLSETVRLVGFHAVAIHGRSVMDSGFYVQSESFRIVDRRASVSLMLGLHALSIPLENGRRFVLGFPQGLELLARDVFARNRQAMLGAFIYPRINDRAYYNLWLRWGGPGGFAEFNYIGILEKVNDQRVYSRSVGVSFGMPLLKFL